ncbi:MAG: amidohydrolase family protein [Pyrinomonadaceae bacterium]|nr:amidohydrolase family protein [Pyrinomonadaceae bacterium]
MEFEESFVGKIRLSAKGRIICALVALTLVGSFVVEAQQIGNVTVQNATGAAGVFVIRNARIVTVSGSDIENGTIVLRDGKIEAVGANVTVPSGAGEIDARGLSVYPGMIDLGTAMGLIEISSGAPGTVDTAELGDMNPNAQAIMAVNPHSAHIDVTRFNGVTSVMTLPLGGVISGQAAIINLNGSSQSEMAVVPNAALVVNFPRTSAGGGFFQPSPPTNLTEAVTARDRQIDRVRRMLRDAEAYGRAQDAYAQNRSLPRPERDIVLASLVPFVRGERAVVFRADREADIRNVVRFAEEMKLRPVILGGNDAWKIAQFLKERNVPVILTGILDLPSREDDPYDVQFETAAKLQAAGVRFCISTGDSGAHVRDLPFHAGMAAAYGLPRAEALKAVTLYPAQIMGLADRMGTIEAGKIANLFVADGDPLDARTNIRYLFIGGRQIPLTNRHTELYEQFKNRR